MGLWDLVKKGAKFAGEVLDNFNADIERENAKYENQAFAQMDYCSQRQIVEKYIAMYENYDTERLKYMYSYSNEAKRMAIESILKERGIIQ